MEYISSLLHFYLQICSEWLHLVIMSKWFYLVDFLIVIVFAKYHLFLVEFAWVNVVKYQHMHLNHWYCGTQFDIKGGSWQRILSWPPEFSVAGWLGGPKKIFSRSQTGGWVDQRTYLVNINTAIYMDDISTLLNFYSVILFWVTTFSNNGQEILFSKYPHCDCIC